VRPLVDAFCSKTAAGVNLIAEGRLVNLPPPKPSRFRDDLIFANQALSAEYPRKERKKFEIPRSTVVPKISTKNNRPYQL